MMNNKKTIPFLVLALLACSVAYAAATQVVITSEPSSINAGQDYTVAFNVTNAANNSVNITVSLYVNGAVVDTATSTDQNTTAPSNSYSSTFNANLYEELDAVYANITATETSNATATANNVTTEITATQSSTTIIGKTTLEGLPSAGTNLGGFLTNLMPGVFAVLLLLALAVTVVAIVYAVRSKIAGGIGGREKE